MTSRLPLIPMYPAEAKPTVVPTSAPRQREVKIVWLFVMIVKRLRASFDPAGSKLCVLGDCLRPYFLDGDVVWYSLEAEPIDGDLVVLRTRYRRSGILCGDHATVERLGIKQLRIRGAEWHACTADGSFEVCRDDLVGVVNAWYRPDWWRRPGVRKGQMQFAISP